MSSSLESAVKAVQTDNYATIVIITVVVQDYFLILSKEIDYVWCRPWSWVSTIFIVVRYVGLCWAITLALAGSSFVPGPVERFKGTVILLVGDWGYVLFLAAADLVMVLRVYAMWHRSKIILGLLLFIYVSQILVSFVWNGIYENPGRTVSVTVTQVLNFAQCSYSFDTASFPTTYRAIPRFVLGATMLVLAVIPTFKQSVAMYKLTKHWQTNRFMKLLVREGILYFVLTLFYNILLVIQPGYPLPTDWMLFLVTVSYSLSYITMPRFIISVRELYDRDLRTGWQGIDTGFGVSSPPIYGENADMSTSAYVDVNMEEEEEEEDTTDGGGDGSEAIRLDAI